jgi:hypothetical protein
LFFVTGVATRIELNLKIIAPISVAILIGTIWILSGKNSTEETRLTNNYQAKQIIAL